MVLLKNWVHYLFIGTVCFFSFFVNNQAIPEDISETRNMAVARENITAEHSSQPLPLWIAAAVERISPGNLPLQRAAAGIGATLMVLFLYWLVTAMTRNSFQGLLSALVLATCFSPVMLGRNAGGDIYGYTLMLGAIFFFYRAVAAKRTRWWDFILSGLLMGLSYLGKGMIPFYTLFIPFAGLYLFLFRPACRYKLIPMLLALSLAGIIVGGWMLYLAVNTQGELLPIAADTTFRAHPWHATLRRFLTESGIWSIFLFTALFSWPWLRKKVAYRNEYGLAVLWLVSALIFLTLFPDGRTRYLLPLLIPASMLIGHYVVYVYTEIRELRLSVAERWIFRLNAFLPALIAFSVPVFYYIHCHGHEGFRWVYLAVLGILYPGTGISIWMGGVRQMPLKVFTGIVILMMLTVGFLLLLISPPGVS